MLIKSGFKSNGPEERPEVVGSPGARAGSGYSSQGHPWGQGPYPREQPLPRSLPSSGNTVPHRCPPKDEGAGAFPFYANF